MFGVTLVKSKIKTNENIHNEMQFTNQLVELALTASPTLQPEIQMVFFRGIEVIGYDGTAVEDITIQYISRYNLCYTLRHR